MLQNLRRVLKWGTVGFMRNGTVSFSSVLVMVIALLMIGSTILISAFLNGVLQEVENKIDINVYFNVVADEEDILELKQSLESIKEVAEVTYISREDALKEFTERHKNDELTLQALKELEENPLRARFNIRAISPDKYDGIAQVLGVDSVVSTGDGESFIDKVNYNDNRLVIDRMTDLIRWVEAGGLIITFVLIALSILITFNTTRLVIYISKEEIGVMRLVGAGKMYIRGPFIVEGIIYGVVAALITVGLFFPITLAIKNNTQELYGGVDLFKYYISNFTEIFLIILLSGIALGSVSSLLAVRRYLKK